MAGRAGRGRERAVPGWRRGGVSGRIRSWEVRRLGLPERLEHVARYRRVLIEELFSLAGIVRLDRTVQAAVRCVCQAAVRCVCLILEQSSGSRFLHWDCQVVVSVRLRIHSSLAAPHSVIRLFPLVPE